MKLPASLSKDVRYAEAYAEWLINLALLIGVLIPADGLSTKTGAILVVANRIGHTLSNRLGQVVAITQGAGIGAPEMPKALEAVTPKVDQIAETVVPQVVAAVEKPDAETILDQVADDETSLTKPPESAVKPDPPADAPPPSDLSSQSSPPSAPIPPTQA